ncbi:MAG TPA: glycosyltransferase family 2 protein [Terriglobales bacterium]|nr:glycosyltransferase family 2 protein [Terriglobales bacterium]
MHIFWWLLGALLAAVWVDRLQDAARGMRHVADITRPEWDRRPEPMPHVSIIVPACDEQEHVAAALASFAAQDYENLEIIAVDDRSRDATGEIMERVAREAIAARPALRFEVLHVRELPAGWLGKTQAMWLAAGRASGDWILFTDADVKLRPDALRRAIAYAEAVKADHLVLFPTHALKTVGESMVIAGFQMQFVFGHRPWKVSDPKARDSMGLGSFNLVRRSVYESIGTFRALRLEVVDDIQLGELVKTRGFSQRAVFGHGLLDLRWGRGGMGIVRNLTKNLFAALHYRWPRAVGACLLLVALNVLPFVGVWLAPGWSKAGFVAAVGAIAVLYAGMYRTSRISPAYVLLHPVNSLILAYTLLRSMAATLWHGGVVWRGTKYSLQKLRRSSEDREIG